MSSTAEVAANTVVEKGQYSQPDRNLHLAVCNNWDELERFRPRWDEILRANPTLTIFSTYEWLASWWKAFGQGKELVALIFSDQNGNTVGLVPLYRERVHWRFGFHFNRLRLVGDGSGDSDNLDLIVLPGNESAVAALFEQWLRMSATDICELNTLHSESAAAQAVLKRLSTSNWNISTFLHPWSAVTLPTTWQAYLAQLSSKERLKVGNRLRRLQNRYAVEFHKCSSGNEMADQLQTLFALHQKRWETRGEPGSFRSEDRKHFYQLMSEQFLRQGWLELWSLRLNGTAVAAQFGFRYRTTVFSLQEGFDPEYSGDSVGYVLRSHVLKELIESGIRRYEFLAGADESKLRWGGETGQYVHIHIAGRESWGSLHLWATRRLTHLKAGLRALLPHRVATRVSALEQLFRSRYRQLRSKAE